MAISTSTSANRTFCLATGDALMVVPLDAKQPSDIMVDFLTATESGLVSNWRLPVGADIQGTAFKVHSFEHKEMAGPDGTTRDVSEVTIINKETGERMVWPLHKPPGDSHAIFHYKQVQPGGQPTPDFTTRLSYAFTLPPKHDTTFTVIAITDKEVVIEAPDGTRKTLTVPRQ